MIVISVLIMVTGLTLPYVSRLSNLLDVALAVDVLVLLLIANTKQANEALSAATPHMVDNSSSCVDYDLGLSVLSGILLPFYYLPLLLTLVAACVWLAKYTMYV